MAARAISGVVVTALLIAVAVVAVFMLFSGVIPLMKTGAPLVVTAQKLSVNYINSGTTSYQVATLDLRVESKADKQLTISKLVIQYIMSDGSVGSVEVTYDPQSGWSPQSTTPEVQVQGEGVLNPGQTQHIMVVLKQDTASGQIRQVTFQIVAKDPAGNEYTATSNTVDIT